MRNTRQTRSGVYEIRNLDTDEIYIGSSGDIGKRWSDHLHALETNTHRNQWLQTAWNTHGAERFRFSVLREIADEAERLAEEIQLIQALEPAYNVNHNPGGLWRHFLRQPDLPIEIDEHTVGIRRCPCCGEPFAVRRIFGVPVAVPVNQDQALGLLLRYIAYDPDFWQTVTEAIRNTPAAAVPVEVPTMLEHRLAQLQRKHGHQEEEGGDL